MQEQTKRRCNRKKQKMFENEEEENEAQEQLEWLWQNKQKLETGQQLKRGQQDTL